MDISIKELKKEIQRMSRKEQIEKERKQLKSKLSQLKFRSTKFGKAVGIVSNVTRIILTPKSIAKQQGKKQRVLKSDVQRMIEREISF